MQKYIIVDYSKSIEMQKGIKNIVLQWTIAPVSNQQMCLFVSNNYLIRLLDLEKKYFKTKIVKKTYLD